MKPTDFSRLSVDELLSVRDIINEILSTKIGEERRNLELRIAELNRADQARDSFSKPGKIPAKYQNPDNPDETWAGRGKTPRWLAAALKKGRKRDDFLIGAVQSDKILKGRRR